MKVVISYDISTVTLYGKRRLFKVAKACADYGQRIQFSVFEVEVDPAQWVVLRARLCKLIDPIHDSLRFYFLGSNWKKRIEHIGHKSPIDLRDPLIF